MPFSFPFSILKILFLHKKILSNHRIYYHCQGRIIYPRSAVPPCFMFSHTLLNTIIFLTTNVSLYVVEYSAFAFDYALSSPFNKLPQSGSHLSGISVMHISYCYLCFNGFTTIYLAKLYFQHFICQAIYLTAHQNLLNTVSFPVLSYLLDVPKNHAFHKKLLFLLHTSDKTSSLYPVPSCFQPVPSKRSES